MTITLNCHPLLGLRKPNDGPRLEIPESCTVRDMLRHLGVEKRREALLLVYVNGEPAWKSTVLRQGDSVALYVAAGGG